MNSKERSSKLYSGSLYGKQCFDSPNLDLIIKGLEFTYYGLMYGTMDKETVMQNIGLILYKVKKFKDDKEKNK